MENVLHGAKPAFRLWSLMVFLKGALWHGGSHSFLKRIYFLAYLELFLLWKATEIFPK
jgi:hypothetical protein